MKKFVLKGLTVAGLILSSISAYAVTFDSVWSVARTNTAGSTTTVLPPHANHFCYLSKVQIEDTDTGDEHAACSVYRQGTVWILDANLGKSSDADVACVATCYDN